MRRLLYTPVIPHRALPMSVFDTIEEHTVSPFRVAVNLTEDVLTSGDLPNWDEILGAFKKRDDTHLPQLEFTNNSTATRLTEELAANGSVTITRASDVLPVTRGSQSFTLSQSGG